MKPPKITISIQPITVAEAGDLPIKPANLRRVIIRTRNLRSEHIACTDEHGRGLWLNGRLIDFKFKISRAIGPAAAYRRYFARLNQMGE